jgi:PAS domain S-box-containing protein
MLIRDMIHPDWKDYLEKEWEKLLTGDMPKTYEYQIIHKTGGIKWLRQNNVLLKDIHGKPIAIQGIVSDITEMKEAQLIIKENEKKLSNIINHSNELFYIHDTDNMLLYVSPQCMDFFGYTQEEMMRNWTDLAADCPMNDEGIRHTMRAIETGEKQDLYLLELIPKDGSRIICQVDESPLKK